jgi:ketosteroid isomerase-like protein
MEFIPLGGQVAGDFAYVVGSEEGTVRLDGGERRPMKLKVTMVFRRQDGQWKAVHRHGEMLLAR